MLEFPLNQLHTYYGFLCDKFYVAYVGKIRCLVIFKLTRSAIRLTKIGTSLSMEHATEIAGIIGDRRGADKYKQVFSKPL